MIVTILIVLAVVIGIFLIAALFVKKEYSIQREIIINKPNNLVFYYIKHLKNQDSFSKWVMTDPNMKKVYKGTDGTVGFVYAWDSANKQAGKGEQEIVSITEGRKLDVEVRFEKPFKGIAKTPFLTEPVATDKTRVIWGMTGINPYPQNLINLLMKKMLEKDLQISLENLKTILEKS